MQYEITDEAAIEFARAFYEALADGVPVDAAVGEARKAISRMVSSTLEWGTPVLYLHSPDGVLFNIQQSSAEPTQRPEPAPAPEKTQISPAQSSDTREGLHRLWTILTVVALPVLVAVIGILFILSGLFRGGSSTGTPTAAGEGSGAPAIVAASSTATNTSEPTGAPPTATFESTPGSTQTSEPEPTPLPADFVRLEETIYGRFDPNVPGNVRLDAGRLYRFTGPRQGRYCRAEFPANGLVWVLCAAIGQPEPTNTPVPKPTAPTKPAPSLTPTPTPAPSLTPTPTAAPSPTPSLTPTPTVPSSVTYQVDVVKISLEEMKTLPGCDNPTLSNNACIVGPGKLNMALDALNTNEVFPFTSDARLLTIFPTQTRIRVVSDSSALPVTTIGNNTFVPEPGQYYKIVVKKEL